MKFIKVHEDMLESKGNPYIEKIKPFPYNYHFRAYYGIVKHLRKAFYIGIDLKD